MNLDEFLNSNWGVNDTCVIYKFTNLINNKVYIGKTKTSIRKRVIAHLSHARVTNKAPKHYFLYAIQKYGTMNFSIEILEHCKEHLLNDREKFWIKHYNSRDPKFGYNCTDGGDGCVNINYTEEYRNKISQSNKKVWSNPEYKKRVLASRHNSFLARSKKVVLLDYSYNIVKIWNYKLEAIDTIGVDLGRLTKNNKLCRAMDFLWMYLDDYKKLDLSTPLIVQLDNDYNLIANFYDYRSANRYIFNLIGRNRNLLFNINQKFTKTKGTKIAGFIWMLYSEYLKIQSK